MRLIRLEEATLYNVIKTTKPDGDPDEQFEKVNTYQVSVQYLDDSVAAAIYGANVSKTYRISSLKKDLENLLLPTINNSEDNLTKYCIEYKGNKFNLQRVTPKYIDMIWR